MSESVTFVLSLSEVRADEITKVVQKKCYQEIDVGSR